MPKQIIIAEQHRIAAVFSEDQIQELIVATGSHQVGDIYLGTVENVLPGIDAAFVNIGDSERNGFMHVSDLGPLRLKRSAGSITELVAPQQKVLVQIMKEPTGTKGPRLTGNITLPGRYLVLMPFGRGVNLSRRIRNENERHRLRALAILIKPAGMGLLVRTEAEGIAEEAIIEDLEALQRQWENIQQEALATRPPALLNRDDDFIQKVLRDVYSADVNRIVTDSHTGMKRVKQHLSNWSSGRMPQGVLVDHHRERVSILEYFRVNAAIREALKPRVDLPSGGYIIIEPTEALTVVDVNSGSFTRSATARETVLWTNCEAAAEIARQLRLRNVAGVIIVDFIDMDSRRDQLQVLEHFSKALRADKARPQISQLSELGLVELTRKRQGQNLYELFRRPCTTCGGVGHIVHLPGETLNTEPLPEPSREYGTPTYAPPLPTTARDGRHEELEPYQDLQELDLINHPNYQERSNNRNNSRRHRRRRATELYPTAKEHAGRQESIRDAEVAEVVEEKPIAVADEGISTKPSRGRGNGRQERKAAEPPEMVSVVMTPDEQRIYAMMGISPLVLAGKEVKNPRTAIVSVVMPGEAPSLETPDSTTPAPIPRSIPSPPIMVEELQPLASVAEPSGESFAPQPSEVLGLPETTAESITNLIPEDSGSEDAANGTVRRRRRRSSAVADAAEMPISSEAT